MKDIVIIGTENIGKEVVKIIEAINSKRNTWNVLGFISLKKDEAGSNIEGYNVLGSIDSMFNYFEGRKKDKFYFFKKLESQNELFTIIAIDNCK
ncbi:nucleoside-diphosphate sugar epimerase/dehydratase [Clostridium perfringens]